MISRDVSHRIVLLRPFLIFLVLTTHIYGALYRPDLQALSLSWETFPHALLSGVIAVCALPLLSIISGVLAGSVTWGRSYSAMLWDKFKTLIVPMLFWNLAMIFWLYEMSAMGRELRPDLALYPFDTQGWFYALTSIFRIPANPPLYFLRELFICFLLMPAFKLVSKGWLAPSILLLFIGYCSFTGIDFGFFMRIDIYGFFFLGILLARHRLLESLNEVVASRFWGLAFFFILCCSALTLYAFEDSAPLFPVYLKVLTLVGPLVLWGLGGKLQGSQFDRFLTWLSPISFSVFLGHAVILALVQHIWTTQGSVASLNEQYGMFWLFCVVLSFAIMACLRFFWRRFRCLCQNYTTGAFFVACGVVFAAMSIYGTWVNYTPVPFWDMWNGYLLAVFRMDAGEGWRVFWELHNEHRLVLAKALFWIDVHVFDASLIFLFTLNVLFALANFLAFAFLARKLVIEERQRYVVLGLLAVLCFSWVQRDNFTWAFQSQFFSAYLLPLLAFIVLARAQGPRGWLYFCLAALLGSASSVTMANGILTLPLMAALAAMLRQGWLRVAILAVLGMLVHGVYFHEFTYLSTHVPLSSALLQRPWELIAYVLVYLGGPWFFLTSGLSLVVPALAGLALIAGAAWLAWLAWRDRLSATWQWVLLTFLLYIGGTVVGTASGRLEHGVAQALTSRYLTPQLLAWGALLLLAAHRYGAIMFSRRRVWLFALIPLLLAKEQWSVHRPDPQTFERMVAALALQVGANDDSYFSKIYFLQPVLEHVAAEAKRRHISAFAHPLIAGGGWWLGQSMSALPARACLGRVEHTVALANGWQRVEGWLLDDTGHIPAQVLMADEQGHVVGYALSGKRRRDLRRTHGYEAQYAGFVGYLKAGAMPALVIGQQPGCVLLPGS